MASKSFDPFSKTNDEIIVKVYDAHIPVDESYDVEALFNILANIMKHETQIADIDPTKGDVPIELAKDNPVPDNLTLAFSKIKQICYQLTCDPALDLDHAHQKTMKILYELERYNWGIKAALALGALAVEYENLLHLTEIQAAPVTLGKSLAVLSKSGFILNRLQVLEMTKQSFAELNNLVKKVLQVTEHIIKLEKLSNICKDDNGDEASTILAAIQVIPVDVYWIIITITACFTHIGYLKGDWENKLGLLEFDERVNSILINLKEIVALPKTQLLLAETKKAKPCIIVDLKRKNTFPYGIRSTDGIDLTDTFVSPPSTDIVLPVSRKSFPEGFIFGTATSAYQIEGATNRGYSAWDHFTHEHPGKIKDGSNGDVACNSYELYKEDIKILKDMNADAYRFSISWSRLIPTGKKSEGVSEDGIKYYNDLINLVLANGLTPFVTLYHVNRPHQLEKEYGGFLSRRIVDDFRDFADLCFEKFGDRVKHWITLNEPYTYCYTGYVVGSMAPGRCSCWQDLNCLGGDSGTEPYQVAHNLLLAHAAAVQVYKNNYKESQKGVIGITLDSLWAVPYSNKDEDEQAALRAMDFVLGWFMEPLTKGSYPTAMRIRVKNRLPEFSPEESQQLQGSFDFLGLNYYTSMFAADNPNCHIPPSYITDTDVTLSYKRLGIPIGEPTASGLYVYPKGLRSLLCFIKDKYNNPLIYITENGMAQFNFPTLPIEVSLVDVQRVHFHIDHLYYILSAIKDYAVNVKGYFIWSLLDNFEWALGYTMRFGMHLVNFADDKKPRNPKLSAQWFKLFLKN
ncbi:hypothetical protein L6164_012848 [Bauhinia variegata]|uniref:Uncharacterized protein n=1 Tax=Bauhinia variegata TaxID=167791 RepID=A0ACB9PB98_BAUVA|nr:hypothetical protein L6164_012848 [Bauhinia variegata]